MNSRNLLYFSAILILIISCQSNRDGPVKVYTVTRGDFLNTITVTGELAAVNSKMINTPFLSWQIGIPKLTKIVTDGDHVERGQLVAQFDAAEIQRTITDAKSELEIARAELSKAQANQQSELEDLTADLEIAKLDYKISQLKLEQASFEAEINRKKIELDLEKSSIKLKQAQQEIEDRKSVNREEISKLELKVQQAQTKLTQAEETLKSLTVLAPSPGIAIIRTNFMTGNKFQVNDQPYPGWPLIGLPDLDSMQANVEINEVDIAKIDISQPARVRLDAYPDTSFKGHVTEIGTLARNKNQKSKVKVFDVVLRIDENDKKLMPGMTVSCEIIISRISDTLFVPLDALFSKDGNRIVYVQKRGNFEARKVTTGTESDNYVVIAHGLRAGDRVALSDPTVQRVETGKKKSQVRTKEQ